MWVAWIWNLKGRHSVWQCCSVYAKLQTKLFLGRRSISLASSSSWEILLRPFYHFSLVVQQGEMDLVLQSIRRAMKAGGSEWNDYDSKETETSNFNERRRNATVVKDQQLIVSEVEKGTESKRVLQDVTIHLYNSYYILSPSRYPSISANVSLFDCFV